MSSGSSTLSAAANLAKLCIGVGVLALPYATSIGGLLFAPIVIAIVAVWNAVACTKMVECKNACANMDYPANLSSTYSRIAYAGAGKVGVMITDFSIIVTLLGVCIAYQITFAQLLQQIPYTNFSTSTLTIVFGLMAIPLCCVPNVGVLAIFSLIGLICLVVSVIAIIIYGIISYGSEVVQDPFGPIGLSGAEDHLSTTVNDSHTHLPLWPETLSSMSSFIGVATFCFGLCSLAFPVEESMRNKNEFGKAVVWSLIFVWFVYVLLGDVGAILYVHDAVGIKDNILSNLPTDSFVARMVRLAMTGVAYLTYPLTLVPPAQMIEHYLLSNLPSWESLLGASMSTSSNPSNTTLRTDSRAGRRDQLYGAVELADITDAETATTLTPLTGSDNDLDATAHAAHAEVSVTARIANRVTIVILTTIIATWIPCFGMIIALLGGFTVTILSFILPSYLHLQIIGYNCIHQPESGAGNRSGALLQTAPTESKRAREDRNSIINTDIALTVGGVILCTVATVVTTIGFLSRVSGEGGQC